MSSNNTSSALPAAPWRQDSHPSSSSTPWASPSYFPGNGAEVDEINEALSPLEEFEAEHNALLARRKKEDTRVEQSFVANVTFLRKQDWLLRREQAELKHQLTQVKHHVGLNDQLRLELRLISVERGLDSYDHYLRQAVAATNRERDALRRPREKEDEEISVTYARLLEERGGLAEIQPNVLLSLDPSFIATHVVTDEVRCHGGLPIPRLRWRYVIETMPDGTKVRVWSSVRPPAGVIAGEHHGGGSPSHTPNNELTSETLEECVARSDRRFTRGLDVAGLTAGLEALAQQLRQSGQGERVESPEPTACPHCPSDPYHERGPCGFPSLPPPVQEPQAFFRPDFSFLGEWVTDMKARKAAEREKRQVRRPTIPVEDKDSGYGSVSAETGVVRSGSNHTASFYSNRDTASGEASGSRD